MSVWAEIRSSVLENLLVWILLVMLAVAVYGSYQRSKELDRACQLLGAHDASYPKPQSAREEIDTICRGREPDED